ncbi:hypothetical protein ABIC08_008401 [Bradyrhizobium sp. RT9b]
MEIKTLDELGHPGRLTAWRINVPDADPGAPKDAGE